MLTAKSEEKVTGTSLFGQTLFSLIMLFGCFCFDVWFGFFFFLRKILLPTDITDIEKLSPNGDISTTTKSTQSIEAHDFKSVQMRGGICCNMAFQLSAFFRCVSVYHQADGRQ